MLHGLMTLILGKAQLVIFAICKSVSEIDKVYHTMLFDLLLLL